MSTIGGYELQRELARGGMGVVYLARDPRLDREVALKVIQAGLVPDGLLRFEREAEALGRLRHPGAVTVHAAGVEAGRPWVAMELIEGEPLSERLRRGALPAAEAAALVRDVARTVAHAHAAGIIHRDLKPENVILTANGPRVIDFGLAGLLDAHTRLTLSGDVLGTPSYMAPEQVTGKGEVGPAADVCGLGGLLHAALTGSAPVRALNLERALALAAGPKPPPSSLRAGIPPVLDQLTAACLAVDPAERPTSAEALAGQLDAALATGLEVRGRPHWLAYALVPLAALALVLGGLVLQRTNALEAQLPALDGELQSAPADEPGPARPDAAPPQQAAPRPDPTPPPPATDPEAAARHLERGLVAARNQSMGPALEAFDAAIEADPTHARAWLERSGCLAALGRLDESLASLDRAVELDPSQPFSWLHRGTLLADLGRLDDALASLDRAVEVGPDVAFAWAERGRLKMLARDLRGARADVERAEALDPANPQWSNNLAWILMLGGDLPAAEAAASRAIDADPRHAPAYRNRGIARAQLGRPEEALADFEEAVRLAPDNPDGYANRSIARRRLRDLPGALADAERALALHPLHPSALVERASTLFDMDRLPEALEAANVAVDQDGQPRTWVLLGEIQTRMGRHDAAQTSLERALELDPRDFLVHRALGALYLERGQPDRARPHLERAAAIAPDDAKTLRLRGQLPE